MANKVYVGKILDVKNRSGKVKKSDVDDEVSVVFECLLRGEKFEVIAIDKMFSGYKKNDIYILQVSQVGFEGSKHKIEICVKAKPASENEVTFLFK